MVNNKEYNTNIQTITKENTCANKKTTTTKLATIKQVPEKEYTIDFIKSQPTGEISTNWEI